MQKIRKNDEVVLIAGKDKGKRGIVREVIPKSNKLVISGINLSTKHQKPTQDSEGGLVKREMPIDVSNVKLIDPVTNAPTKVAFKTLDSGEKVRYSKKSGEIIKAREGK